MTVPRFIVAKLPLRAAHFDFAFLFFLDADLARPLAVLLTRLVLRVVFTLLPMDSPNRCEPDSMQPKSLRVTGQPSLSEQCASASGFSEASLVAPVSESRIGTLQLRATADQRTDALGIALVRDPVFWLVL
jgi:hypothetical protein